LDAVTTLGVTDNFGDTVGLEIGFAAVVETVAISIVKDRPIARENPFPRAVETEDLTLVAGRIQFQCGALESLHKMSVNKEFEP
jgi:hypothetical protein